MVRTIRWTETAIKDLNESARFIHRDSPYYAAAFVKEVRRAARSLNLSSERERIVPESERPDIREIYVKSYRLIYQVKTHEVFLLSLIHGSRDLETLWKKRFEDYQF